jgi:phage major head subunit gpT-like protein
MIVNKSTVVALEKSFQKIFTDALHGASESRMVSRFASRFPNTAAALDLSWLAAIPGMRKLVGTAVLNNLELVNWQIPNEEWEDTLAVKLKDIERDQLGVYNERLRLLADAGARHPDELLGQVLLAGFETKDYTGKNFYDTGKKHFPTGKASFSNKLTVELHPKTFELARKMLRTMKIVFPDGSETKLPLGRDMVLVVGPANESLGREILTAETIPGGGTNVNRGTATLEVWNEIGDGPEWFLFDQGFAVKPFAFSDEKPVSLASVTDLDDSHVLLKKEFLYQAYGRYNVGYMLPQLIIGSTGADEYTDDEG